MGPNSMFQEEREFNIQMEREFNIQIWAKIIQTKKGVFTYMEYLYNNIAKVIQKLSTTLNV
jgi:hypothetical protein